ncbi:MAG: hypothetical protein DRP74_06790 [Candidatus Omnitrophota bacterium]|nr:MAG: hypothetical protein DRP74_06790 [Candidatus Omnitrophota bacterium]
MQYKEYFYEVIRTPLFLTIICILLLLIVPAKNLFMIVVRLFIGILGIFYMPGFCIVKLLFGNRDAYNKSVVYIAIGIMYHLLVLFASWWYYRFVGPVSFSLLVYVTSTLAVVGVYFIMALNNSKKLSSITMNIQLKGINYWLTFSLLIFLVISLYYQQYAPSPHTDGAAYMDMARNLVKYGIYRSNMMNTVNEYGYIETSTGLIPYFYNYLLIALFFMMGDVSFLTAKIMLIFIHLLNITLIYYVTIILFNRRTATIASLLSAISPIILAHIGLAGGAEIPSILLMLTAIYFLLCLATDSSNHKLEGIVTGILIGIAYNTWSYTGFIMLLSLVAYFLYHISITKAPQKKAMFTLFLILDFSMILEIRFLLTQVRYIIGAPLPTLFPFLLLMSLILLKFRENYKALISYLYVLLFSFIMIYSFALAQFSTPQLHEYLQFISSNRSATSAIEITGVKRYLSLLMNFNGISRSWSNYWEVLQNFAGTIIVYSTLLSFLRLNKLKENMVIASFPTIHVLLWCFLIQHPLIQPRQQINASIFYFILTASFIDFVLVPLDRFPKKWMLKIILFKRSKINFDLKQLIIIILISITFLTSLYSSYQKGIDLMQSWDFKSRFGWDSAIEWIKNNTQEDDIIMSRSANYFAWYTERMIAWPPINDSIGLDDLIEDIRMHKAKYLVIDERTYYIYPNLRGLYLNPVDFLGAHIVFKSEISGHRVIIYNVTNIALGELESSVYILDSGEKLANWTKNEFYGNASLELDTYDKIQGNCSIKYTQTLKYNSLVIIFKPEKPVNLSTYDYLVLKTKSYNASYIAILLATDSLNYFVKRDIPLSVGNWTNVKVSLKSLDVGKGSPYLEKICFITIYFYNLEIGETYSVWLDGVYAYKAKYVIKKG